MDISDPILAVSSPPGRSPRGLIRITGDGLGPVLSEMFAIPPGERTLSCCRLTSPAIPCLALYMPGPRSFTAQDMLEIQVPGNPALLNRILHGLIDLLQSRGLPARLAEPGEFTQRAFFAGRIDLTRAEGIAATIGAESDAQLEAARLLRTGRLGAIATEMVDRLGHLLALVEAGIDFVDQDDVVPIAPGALDQGIAGVAERIEQLLARSRSFSALEALPWVVIIGPPNAGKSTLFNTLLGHERAVTTDIAGTTRDVLTEPLHIQTARGEAEVMLVDVAGFDPSGHALNQAMQQAAGTAIARAELILWLHTPDEQIPEQLNVSAPVLHLHAKADLLPGAERGPFHGAIPVSAVTGLNIDVLRARITERLADRAVTLSGQMLALTPRHDLALRSACESLYQARRQLRPSIGRPSLADAELIADPLQRALDHLAGLGGQVTADDVIGRIFSTFCIGK